jgi:hypothetical protein
MNTLSLLFTKMLVSMKMHKVNDSSGLNIFLMGLGANDCFIYIS